MTVRIRVIIIESWHAASTSDSDDLRVPRPGLRLSRQPQCHWVCGSLSIRLWLSRSRDSDASPEPEGRLGRKSVDRAPAAAEGGGPLRVPMSGHHDSLMAASDPLSRGSGRHSSRLPNLNIAVRPGPGAQPSRPIPGQAPRQVGPGQVIIPVPRPQA